MTIKIQKIKDIEKLVQAINNCTGKVELHTDENDCYNLKSRLSQLISINVILNGISNIDNTRLFVEKSEDYKMLNNHIVGTTIDGE